LKDTTVVLDFPADCLRTTREEPRVANRSPFFLSLQVKSTTESQKPILKPKKPLQKKKEFNNSICAIRHSRLMRLVSAVCKKKQGNQKTEPCHPRLIVRFKRILGSHTVLVICRTRLGSPAGLSHSLSSSDILGGHCRFGFWHFLLAATWAEAEPVVSAVEYVDANVSGVVGIA
jgi:hypothetical protein